MYTQNPYSGASKWVFFITVILMFAGIVFGVSLSNSSSASSNDPSQLQAKALLFETWQRVLIIIGIGFGITILISTLIWVASRLFSLLYLPRKQSSKYVPTIYRARNDIQHQRDLSRLRHVIEDTPRPSDHNQQAEISHKDKRKTYPRKSIVAIMRLRRVNNLLIVISSLLLLLFASFFLSLFVEVIRISTQILITSCIFILALGHLSFEYRVTHGLFGNNEREAREIIEFLLQESENIDFTDRGKPKKILSEEDLLELQNLTTQPEGVPQ